MPRIGITGHMNLTPASVDLVREEIRRVLTPYAEQGLVGVSCIAAGSDSIFAEVVLELGGSLEVVLPAADYRQRKVKPDHAPLFDSLVERAAKVVTMPFAVSNREAYAAANETLLSSIDQLVAVWDGRTPVDNAGTGSVVADARSRGLPVTVVWPEGAARADAE